MIEVGRRYEITRKTATAVKRFTARVTSVEDRGDSWYIGYKPDDIRVCRWGYLKVRKTGQYRSINYSLAEIG